MNEAVPLTWRDERRKLSDLKPRPDNPRHITDVSAERLAQSYEEYEQPIPLIVNPDGQILDGHQRLDVWLARYGNDFEVDVRVPSRPLTQKEWQKLTVLLHEGTTGAWDFEALAEWDVDLTELTEWGFDLDTLIEEGFSGDGHEPPEDLGPQLDRAIELQEKWQVKNGSVWQCGEHFVICGDCREPQTWERLLVAAGVDKVNGVFTSPPYAEQRKKQYGGVPVDQYVNWWEAVQQNVRAHLASDGSFFVNIKPHCKDGERVLYVLDLVLAMKRRWGWRFVDELCWTHEGIPGQWGTRFKNGFEPIYHFCTHSVKLRHDNVKHPSERAGRSIASGVSQTSTGNVGFRVDVGPGFALPSNVLRILHGIGREDSVKHPAKFPVALPDFFIRAYSDPGDVWCDPFLGSGTTIVAAHQNDRRGIGIEKLERYVAVTLERMSGLGLQPRLATDA